MVDGLDALFERLTTTSAVKITQSKKKKLKSSILSTKIRTGRNDQIQHEPNLNQLKPTLHRLVQFAPFNSVLNHIISYMLSPSVGPVVHLPHNLNGSDTYGILSHDSKQPSEPIIWILNTLEYYLSDVYLASNYTFQKLFNIKSCYDKEKDVDQYSEDSWDDVIQTLLTTLKKWNREDSRTDTNNIYDDIVEYLNDVLKTKDWNKILFHNNFSNQNRVVEPKKEIHSKKNCQMKGKNISFFSNNVLWLPVTVFLQLSAFKKIGTSCDQLINACKYSKTLKVGRFPPCIGHRCAESIIGFISSTNWDQSVFGRHTCNVGVPQDSFDLQNASKSASHQATCGGIENEFDHCEESSSLLKTAINRLLTTLNPSVRDTQVVPADHTIGEWYIGRYWPTRHHFKELQKQLHERIFFIDNLPLECSPSVIELFFDKRQIPVKHVSMPRFCDSKKNKGFAFVECSCASHVQQGIDMLHGKPARTLYTTENGIMCTLTPRNSRPLFCCSHSEWFTLKSKRKNVNSLGYFRENKTKALLSEKHESFHWVAIEPIEYSVSPLELMQFIQHSVVPLEVYFPPHSMKALVKLSSEQDAHYLCFDILICRRSLGGSYGTTARITNNPLESSEWDA